MAYDQIIKKAANNSYIAEVMLRDSTTGQAKTGIAFGSVAYAYWREGAATGANAVTINFYVTGCIDARLRILLVDVDIRDVQRLGLTALPASSTLAVKPAVTLATADVSGNLNAQVKGIDTDAISAASVAAAAVTKIQSGLSTLTAAGVWDALLTGITTAGSIGKLIKDYLDAQVSLIKAKTDNLPASPAAVGSAMAVSDKTGFSLSTAGIQAIWDALTSALTSVGSIGKLLVDNINATISSRGTSTLTAQQVWEYASRSLTTFGTLIADIWANATRSLTDKAGFTISGTKTTLDGLNDITAASVWAVGTRSLTTFGTLVADTAAAVWAVATSTLTGVGTIGKLLYDKINPLTFTTPNKVDASATATVDEAAIAAAVIAGLGGATITVQSMITAGGDITIIKGVTYTTELILTYTYTGSLTGYTAAMNCHNAGITDKAVTIGGSAGAWTLTIAFTGAQSTALTACLDSYSIVFTKTSDGTKLGYGVEGNIQVRNWWGLV